MLTWHMPGSIIVSHLRLCLRAGCNRVVSLSTDSDAAGEKKLGYVRCQVTVVRGCTPAIALERRIRLSYLCQHNQQLQGMGNFGRSGVRARVPHIKPECVSHYVLEGSRVNIYIMAIDRLNHMTTIDKFYPGF